LEQMLKRHVDPLRSAQLPCSRVSGIAAGPTPDSQKRV
jgi:hypothetical protein